MSKSNICILDLDETMIHCKTNPNNPNKAMCHWRPNLLEFLKYVDSNFEVWLWTFGDEQYANPIVDSLEKKLGKKIFLKRFFTKNASSINSEFYWKRLKNVTKNLQNVFLIDDLYENGVFQSNNVIRIKPYLGAAGDDELKKLVPLLEKLKGAKDVRKIIREYQFGYQMLSPKTKRTVATTKSLGTLSDRIKSAKPKYRTK